MENLNLKNQSKTIIEKTSKEKGVYLGIQEQESGKRENITLEIDGQKIEAIKYYLEYPDRIQKETGILGYERVKIPKENFKASFESIASVLSDGEYPNKCLTHIMGGHAHKDHKPGMMQDFAQDKFFLQKIYDTDTIKRKRGTASSVENLFNYSANVDDYDSRSGKQSTFSLYKKNIDGTREKIVNHEYIGNITKYEKELSSGEYFAATTESGLSTIASNFWESYKPSVNENSFAVGFSLFGTDNLFNEYLEKSLKEYSLITEKPDEPLGVPWIYPLSSLIILYFLSKSKKNIDLAYSDKSVKSQDLVGPEFSKIMDEFIQKNPNAKAIRNIDFTKARAKYFPHENENGFYLGGNRAEYRIPVFIGNNEIPQLSWGHAKYAHYFNDESFNFFKFKHADHLPSKEEINSSEF